MNIETFDDLLRAARAQSRPQRLLFVFATAVLPDDATAAQRAAFDAGEGGALEPLMCVDKAADALGAFDLLLDEAAQAQPPGRDWQIVLAAAMDDADEAAVAAALDRLVDAVRAGRIGGLLPLDRSGRVLALDAD